MKTATIFLVAVTLFTSLMLESSAVPAELNGGSLSDVIEKIRSDTGELFGNVKAFIGGVGGDVKDGFDDAIKSLLAKIGGAVGNSVKVDKKLKKFITKSIEKIYEALTKLLQANENVVAKAAGDEKEVLSKILKRLKNFDYILSKICMALERAVESGKSAYIKIFVFILSKAIDKTRLDQAEIIQTLKVTPGELVDSFERVVKKKVDSIIAMGEDIVNKLDTFLSTRGLNA